MIREAERFNLTTSEHQNEHVSDEEDEDALEAIRRRRLEHLHNRNRAKITEISDKEDFLKAIESTHNGARAVFHIYRDDLEATETLNEALMDLAAQTRNCGFFKVQPKVLDMSSRFVSRLLIVFLRISLFRTKLPCQHCKSTKMRNWLGTLYVSPIHSPKILILET